MIEEEQEETKCDFLKKNEVEAKVRTGRRDRAAKEEKASLLEESKKESSRMRQIRGEVGVTNWR